MSSSIKPGDRTAGLDGKPVEPQAKKFRDLSWAWSDESNTLTFFVDGQRQRVRLLPTAHVCKLMQAMLDLSDEEIAKVVAEADTDHDGFLTVRQWRELLLRYPIFGALSSPDMLPPSWLQSTLRMTECDEEKEKQKTEKKLQDLTVFESFCAGGLAGACSKTVIAPGDRIKILYQVNPNRKFSLRSAFKTGQFIVRQQGILALWRGNGATVIRVVPYAAITYMTFDRYHKMISDVNHGRKNVYTRLVAGAAAGATATACTYPFDLMRARMAAHWASQPKYAGYLPAFRQVIQTEGWTALFRGSTVTLLGIMPYAGLSFATFETLKAWIKKTRRLKSDRDIPTHYRIAFGGFAGLVGQSATYPLDIVRRRMQVYDPSSGREPYKSIADAFIQIYKSEGLRKGLYKGLSMNWIKGPIAVSVSFNVNDFMKGRFREWKTNRVLDLTTIDRYDDLLRLSLVESVMAGAFAGAVSKTATAPIGRLKRLQLRKLGGKAGIETLWRGNISEVIRIMPFSAIQYTAFDCYELALMRHLQRDTDITSRFIAGSAAGATATLLTYPFDVIHARMISRNVHVNYSGYTAAVQSIAKAEGFSALFSGMYPAMLGIVPYAGVSFSVFHTLKTHIRKRFKYQHEDDIPLSVRLGAGFVAGFMGFSATYPLHVVRKRMQIYALNDANDSTKLHRNVWSSLKRLCTTDGVQGLYQGLRYNWMKSSVYMMAVGISFTINDVMRSYIGHNKDIWMIAVADVLQGSYRPHARLQGI